MPTTPPIPTAATLSAATNAEDTKLWVSLDGTSWVEIGEITGLPDLPSGEQSTYETTHMSSGQYKEFKKTRRIEGAETDVEGNFVLVESATTGTALATLRALENATGSLPVRIDTKQAADTYYATTFALFHSLKLSNPMEDVRKFTITAKWTAPMTITKAV